MNRGSGSSPPWLVAKHGPEVPAALHSHITSRRRSLADAQHIASWLLIDDAVQELVRMKRKSSDTIH
jgi:hypothetical protein